MVATKGLCQPEIHHHQCSWEPEFTLWNEPTSWGENGHLNISIGPSQPYSTWGISNLFLSPPRGFRSPFWLVPLYYALPQAPACSLTDELTLSCDQAWPFLTIPHILPSSSATLACRCHCSVPSIYLPNQFLSCQPRCWLLRCVSGFQYGWGVRLLLCYMILLTSRQAEKYTCRWFGNI